MVWRLSKLRESDSKSLVVIMSGHGTIETAVQRKLELSII